ncbi:RNA ligase family protein [Phaeobacter sp. CNT1-3]|nr:RNA ligase family protein [Phaeobacter sp. CNT1-3]
MSVSSRKYGRSYHLPQSPGATSDDKIMTDTAALFSAPDVVITEKMDGENTTIYTGGCHPRSLDARYHPSRDWMKAFAAAIAPQLQPEERIVGEYLFARHSIAYENLPSYFMGFAYIKDGLVQSWDATRERFGSLGITPVPELYRGPLGNRTLADLIKTLDFATQEGFVLRDAATYPEAEQPIRLAKYVRANHVQSETHWMAAPLVKNELG